jgi:hypothetical protein
MRLLKLLTVTFAATSLSCATTHPGVVAKTGAAAGTVEPVIMSIRDNTDLSDKHYMFLEYTIENKTEEWMNVQVTSVVIDGTPTEILTDDKLESWIEGAELKLAKAQYNTAMILGSMAAVGGAVAATSGHDGTAKAGAIAMGAAAVGAVGTGIRRDQQKANSGKKGVNGTVQVPSTHILTPFKVSPESYVRRWIVVTNPTHKIEKEVAGTTKGIPVLINTSAQVAVGEGKTPSQSNFATTIKTVYAVKSRLDRYGN